jgi:broad specificity phosphatase PhoE
MQDLITEMNKKQAPAGRSVYIIRHGQTKLNAEDKIRAWLDVPLDEVGIEQAQELGEAMRDEGIELDGLISSDLQRAIQTSLEVSKIAGYPLLGITKDLRPLNVGTYSGQDGKMVHKIIAEHARNNPDAEIGGGESFNTFRHRILGGIIGILNSHRGLKLGLVSHSRGERALHAWVANECDEDLELDLDVFLAKGEGTATASELQIVCPLVLP